MLTSVPKCMHLSAVSLSLSLALSHHMVYHPPGRVTARVRQEKVPWPQHLRRHSFPSAASVLVQHQE